MYMCIFFYRNIFSSFIHSSCLQLIPCSFFHFSHARLTSHLIWIAGRGKIIQIGQKTKCKNIEVIVFVSVIIFHLQLCYKLRSTVLIPWKMQKPHTTVDLYGVNLGSTAKKSRARSILLLFLTYFFFHYSGTRLELSNITSTPSFIWD